MRKHAHVSQCDIVKEALLMQVERVTFLHMSRLHVHFDRLLSICVAQSLPLLSLCMPLLASAAADEPARADLAYGTGVLTSVAGIVNFLVPLLIAVALALFLWGVVSFLASSGNEEARREGGKRIVWGVVALFVAVSVWGLVGLINQITGIEAGGGIELPQTGL